MNDRDQLLQAFQRVLANALQPMTLKASLQQLGLSIDDATALINRAVTEGVLEETAAGGFRLRDG